MSNVTHFEPVPQGGHGATGPLQQRKPGPRGRRGSFDRMARVNGEFRRTSYDALARKQGPVSAISSGDGRY
jgi:hypothetical protein